MRSTSPLIGIALFAGWIAVEIILFNLVAGWTGGGVAFFLLVMKSVLGVVFVQRVIRQKLFQALRRGGIVLDGSDAAAAWLKGLGGILVVMPGFATGIAGLALLTPSIRRYLVGRSKGKAANSRDIDLSDSDWREIPEEPKRRVRKPDTTANT